MKMGKGATLLILSLLSVLSAVAALTCSATNLYQPEKIDVTSYAICFSATGTPFEITCPTGLVFNAALKGCSLDFGDLPLANECVELNQKLLDTGTTDCTQFVTCVVDTNNAGKFKPGAPTTCPTSEIFNVLLSTCVPNTEWKCGETKPDCDSEKFPDKYYPVDGDSDSYYRCIETVLIKGKCPTDTSFDFKQQMCLKKTGSGGGETIGIVSIDKICEGKDGKFVADPNYCIGYYYCINGSTPYWSYCSEEGQYFNNGYCTKTKPNTCKCEGLDLTAGKVFVPTVDATKYIICEEGKAPIQKTCPSGYVFSKEEKVCVPTA